MQIPPYMITWLLAKNANNFGTVQFTVYYIVQCTVEDHLDSRHKYVILMSVPDSVQTEETTEFTLHCCSQ